MPDLLTRARMAKAAWQAGGATLRYIRRNASREEARPSGPRVVLASFCAMPTVVHCYAELLPRFAKCLDARVEAFRFDSSRAPDPLLLALYDSFGATLALERSKDPDLLSKADARAKAIFAGLSCKADIARIAENGILLGDLIYDTYLRDLLLATVDLRDPRLLGYITEALVFLYSSEAYFERNDVAAVFVDHLVYIWQGALQREAMRRGIPIYTVYYHPRLSAQRIDLGARKNGLTIPARYNYWAFPTVFGRLSPDEQAAAAERGKAYLEHRLSGGMQSNILPGQSAYAAPSASRALPDTTAPKILILLHDFCDAVHVYRSLLFEDFYEWIHFLLREASATDFEWFVKPHPNMNDYRRRGIENSNQKVLAELRERYPRIRFLEPSVSNRQLVDEGLAAVFTMYGTAAHEFPWLGVPAVSGADNPHVAYRFSRTPQSVAEYADLIRRAGHLGAVEDRERIPEYCHMFFLYAGERLGAAEATFDPMPPAGQGFEDVFTAALAADRPETRRSVDAYVTDLLNDRTPACIL